ncbi:MAG: hypothetical protein NC935_03755 [Candidatus Omnitrophica bacterium]|nr:hypothetical protein [Candidatus Omnitrophota bacterium]
MLEKRYGGNESKRRGEPESSFPTYLRNLGFKSDKSISYLIKFSEQKISSLIDELERLGLNAVEILDQQPMLIKANIKDISEKLEKLNFNVTLLATAYPQVFLKNNFNKLRETLSYLQKAGFKDPHHLIIRFPKKIIEYLGVANIRKQIGQLKKRGFAKPVKVIEYFFNRGIFYLNFENIDKTIQDMKKLKFSKPTSTIEKYPKIIYSSIPLEEKVNYLKEIGFKEPIRIIQSYPSLIHLKIENHLEKLRGLGFKNPVSLIEKNPRLLGIDLERSIKVLREHNIENPIELIDRVPFFAYRNLDKIIDIFKKADVDDPLKIFKKNPRIIAYANRLEETIEALKKIGVKNPIDTIVNDQSQSFLKYYKKIDSFINHLLGLGFSNPTKLIIRFPPILGKDIEKILGKLQSFGFNNPIQLIEKFPQVSALNLDRIINGIKELGFHNPIRILELNPYLFGFNSNTLRKRLKLLKTFDKKYNLSLFDNNGGLSDKNLMFLNTSNFKIFFSLRLAFYLNDLKHLREFITHNPFISYYILKFLEENKQVEDEALFFRSLMNKYKRILTKSDRKNIIAEVKDKLEGDIIDLKNRFRQEPENQRLKNLLKMALLLKKMSP